MYTILLASLLAAPNPAKNDKPTALGVAVVARPVAVVANDEKADLALTPMSALVGTEFPVVGEQCDRLLLRYKGTDVWVRRSETMTPKEAIAYFTEQIATSPQLNHYYRRCKAYEMMHDVENALKDHDELIKQSPQTSAYWNNRANLFSRQRDYQKALEGYDEAIRLSPTSFIPIGNRGNAFLNLREWDKAIAAYTQSIEVSPTYARSYAGRSGAYREKKDFDNALKDAERGVELDPMSPNTLVARGNFHFAMKDQDAAMADFEAVLQYDPLYAGGYYGRAGVHLARKAYQPAIRDLDVAMRLSPQFAGAMARRAEAWGEVGNLDRALLDLNEAIRIDDRYAPAYRHKAWLFATRESIRDGGKALVAARKAMELWKNEGVENWEALAAALAETGDFAGAIEWQKKALADAAYVKDKGDGVAKRLAAYVAKKPHRE